MILQNVPLKFSAGNPVIITEAKKDGKISKKVRGVAIKASTSRNGITYVIEELGKSIQTLTGKNIKMNHSGDVTDNVAKITSSFMQGDEGLYEAEVYNTAKYPDAQAMVENGLIQYVSIEAIAGELVKEGDKMVARNMEFTGLGFVDTPGIPEASVAIAEAFKKEEIMEAQHHGVEPKDGKCPEGYKMLDGKCEPMDESAEAERLLKEKKESEIMEEKMIQELIASENKKVLEEVSKTVSTLQEEIKTLKEEAKKPKGVVTEEKKNVLPLKKERTNKGADFWCEEGLTTDEKRLY